MVSAVVATMIVNVKNIRSKMLIEKAVIDRNIMMKLKSPKSYSPRIMEEIPTYFMLTWVRIPVNSRYKDPADKKGGILSRRRFRLSYSSF